MTVILRGMTGVECPLALEDWSAPASGAEHELLGSLDGPVLDLGCGPGRLVVALAEQGTPAMGIDASPVAADRAVARGASVLCRSLFEPMPGEGRWRSVLLFDGNIGIGGDPARLLRRAASLMAPGGSTFAEVDPPGALTEVTEARVETLDHEGPWFPWAWVAADRLDDFATPAGLTVTDWLRPDGRWIARLQAPVAA